MITDRLYHHGAFQALQLQSKFSPTYFYYFRFNTTKIVPKLMKIGARHYSESADLQDSYLGVSHGDDVFLIYQNPSSRGQQSIRYSEDKNVGHELINLYYNFAKEDLAVFNNVIIENVQPSEVNCLEIFSAKNFSVVKKDEDFGNGKFWNSLNIVE